jgi:hypothetical protein
LFTRIFFHPGTRQEKKESHCPDLIRFLPSGPKNPTDSSDPYSAFIIGFRRGKIFSGTAVTAFCLMVKAAPQSMEIYQQKV